MLPLITITISFLVFVVLVGLLGRRIDRQREEHSPPGVPHGPSHEDH